MPSFCHPAAMVWHILDLEESWYFLSTCGAISSLYTVSGKLDQKGCIGLWWQQPLCRGKAWPSAVPMLPVVVVSRVTHSEPQNWKKVLFSKCTAYIHSFTFNHCFLWPLCNCPWNSASRWHDILAEKWIFSKKPLFVRISKNANWVTSEWCWLGQEMTVMFREVP